MALEMLAPMVLALLLSAVVVTDIKAGVIRNWTNAGLLVSGLLFAAFSGVHTLWLSLAGAGLGGAVLALVAWGYRRLRPREGLGLGDVKFMVGAGAWVLPQGIAPLLLLASLSALLFIMAGLAPRIKGHEGGVAFGPFLSAGCFAVYAAQALEIAPWTA